MAKYKSLFSVEGSLGEVNFYKSEDGYHMRTKGGVSKSRISKDPAFARTRENNEEFGNSATSGKHCGRPALIWWQMQRTANWRPGLPNRCHW